MLRLEPSRLLSRSTLRFISSSNRHIATRARGPRHQVSSQCSLGLSKPKSLALALQQPLYVSFPRYASNQPGNLLGRNNEEEKALGEERLEAHPGEVSAVSSVHQVFHEKATEDPEEDIDMLAGVKSDLRAVKETFEFGEVPRAALVMGLAGVVPYAVTSLTTLYLAWDINQFSYSGTGFMVSERTAELLLHIIEPLQIGYGAVIISFLGAIHWGFEWSKYGGVNSYGRYAIGTLAPAVAWPTLLLPIEYALIAQFSAFIFLYYADANAVVRGWAPHWYTTYRFVLTFIVGISIVISLAGRGHVADKIHKMPSPADRVKALRDSQFEALEKAEIEERALRMAQGNGEDDEEDEEEDEDDE